jgi:hypothetical protein
VIHTQTPHGRSQTRRRLHLKPLCNDGWDRIQLLDYSWIHTGAWDFIHLFAITAIIKLYPESKRMTHQLLLLVSVYLWLYSPRRPQPLFQFLNLYTVSRTPWTGDQAVARPLPKHRIKANRHPCLERDSNPRSQRSSGRRQFMP